MKVELTGTPPECATVIEVLRQCPQVAVVEVQSQYATHGEATAVAEVWVRGQLPADQRPGRLRPGGIGGP